MVWAAINCEHLFGPYFYDGPISDPDYLAILENLFIPQLQILGMESNVWFQQNEAPAHLAITVREYLNEVFPSS